MAWVMPPCKVGSMTNLCLVPSGRKGLQERALFPAGAFMSWNVERLSFCYSRKVSQKNKWNKKNHFLQVSVKLRRGMSWVLLRRATSWYFFIRHQGMHRNFINAQTWGEFVPLRYQTLTWNTCVGNRRIIHHKEWMRLYSCQYAKKGTLGSWTTKV